MPASSGCKAESLLSSGEDFELMLSGPAELDETVSFERLKQRFPDMPLVVVTATQNIAAVPAYVRKGAYDYLLKTFEREQLLATVRRALEYRRLKLGNRALPSPLNLSKACASHLSHSSDTQTACALSRWPASRNGWQARRD